MLHKHRHLIKLAFVSGRVEAFPDTKWGTEGTIYASFNCWGRRIIGRPRISIEGKRSSLMSTSTKLWFNFRGWPREPSTWPPIAMWCWICWYQWQWLWWWRWYRERENAVQPALSPFIPFSFRSLLMYMQTLGLPSKLTTVFLPDNLLFCRSVPTSCLVLPVNGGFIPTWCN